MGYNNNFRNNNNRNFRDSKPRMHTAVCDQCGNGCEVPFEPTGDKPVYCSACFGERGGNSRTSKPRDRYESRAPRFSRNDNNSTMHKAVCDECGKDCEVPFMPSSDKPIYCRDCFGSKGGGRKSDSPKTDLKMEIDQINAKLSQILGILGSSDKKNSPKTITAKSEEKSSELLTEKSTKPKKIASKKIEKKKPAKLKKEVKTKAKTAEKKTVAKKKSVK
jgi:CxxC-x17-CxxC domain-containing protein